MNLMRGFATLLATGLLSSIVQAEDARHVSFVTCPIFRDTARQCWIAEHEGKLYYIGRFGMGPAPQLLHKVLVEGTIADEAPSCSGIVLNPLYLSSLVEIDTSCNTVLPDNGDQPSESLVQDMSPEQQALIGKPMPPPQPPFADRTFLIDYSFDSTFLHQMMQREVETVARYAIASQAKRITVTGYRASVLLDSGERLVERASLAEERARGVADALTIFGVAPAIVEVKWVSEPVAGTGVDDFRKRKTEIAIRGIRKK